MRHLILFLIAIPFVIGCCCPSPISQPESSSNSTDFVPQRPAPKKSNTPEVSSKVEVTKMAVRIVPWKSAANGKRMQMVMVTWKNTGTVPIALVEAEITAFNAQGETLSSSVAEYTIYAAEKVADRIQPGKTYTDPEGEGFILIPDLDGVLAKTVEVRITNCNSWNELLD